LSPRPVSAATLANGQLLFPIETSELLQIHDDPLAVEHHVDAAIAEATALRRHLLHRLANGRIVRPNAAIPQARPIHRQNLARPTLAHPVLNTDTHFTCHLVCHHYAIHR
jgi:hypothetical protein